jgi:O-acetyl-ADP-ribose deacetylase (regulator of RNase III)
MEDNDNKLKPSVLQQVWHALLYNDILRETQVKMAQADHEMREEIRNFQQKRMERQMKIVKGDLLDMAREGYFDVIVHGCNCFCTMGAGIAKQIKELIPGAFEADMRTIRGDESKLGTITSALTQRFKSPLVVVNAYIQYEFSSSRDVVDYDAVRSCMELVGKRYHGKRIGMPKIGAGLAGGDWIRIKDIIEEELGEENVTIVEWNKA